MPFNNSEPCGRFEGLALSPKSKHCPRWYGLRPTGITETSAIRLFLHGHPATAGDGAVQTGGDVLVAKGKPKGHQGFFYAPGF